MSEPRTLGSAALVRLVAAREIAARVRDKNFIISSIVIIVLLIGTLGLQVALSSGDEEIRVGVVGDVAALEPALEAQGQALDVDVAVRALDDVAAARTAIENEDVDGVLVAESGQAPELLVQESAGGSLQAVVQGAVAQLSLSEQLSAAGLASLDVPEVTVTALDPDADQDGQRVVVAIIGIGVLYGLLILFGQFVAQGVVEEKASRVVELLLATMKPVAAARREDHRPRSAGAGADRRHRGRRRDRRAGVRPRRHPRRPDRDRGRRWSPGSCWATPSTRRSSPSRRPWSAGRRTSAPSSCRPRWCSWWRSSSASRRRATRTAPWPWSPRTSPGSRRW